MSGISTSLNKIRTIEDLSNRKSLIHDLSPATKILTIFVFIITAVSFKKYEISGLLPLFLFPITIISLADIPYGLILSRLMISLPFIILIGIFNPLIERDIAITLWAIPVSYGFISFITMLIKCILTIISAMLLISTTPIADISVQLVRFKIPRAFVLILLFVYRYIFILINEADRMVRAAKVRSKDNRGISIKYIGAFIGQLILRSFNRAERIYSAMQLKGFTGEFIIKEHKKMKFKDYTFLFIWCLYFIFVRLVDLPLLIGEFIT